MPHDTEYELVYDNDLVDKRLWLGLAVGKAVLYLASVFHKKVVIKTQS